jgi:hypothetical protein
MIAYLVNGLSFILLVGACFYAGLMWKERDLQPAIYQCIKLQTQLEVARGEIQRAVQQPAPK